MINQQLSTANVHTGDKCQLRGTYGNPITVELYMLRRGLTEWQKDLFLEYVWAHEGWYPRTWGIFDMYLRRAWFELGLDERLTK